MSPALYLIDTSGLFRILQDKIRQAWSEQLAAGVIATCPLVERRLLQKVFGRVPMTDGAYERPTRFSGS
jgi:hypothetical protein